MVPNSFSNIVYIVEIVEWTTAVTKINRYNMTIKRIVKENDNHHFVYQNHNTIEYSYIITLYLCAYLAIELCVSLTE